MSNQTSDNNKRIAKNTMMLYIRMLFSMLVTLYTSRVVLDKLGVSDFGIYNVVGGIATIFTFVNTAMTSSTQRFLIFELGKKEKSKINEVFSLSVMNHLLMVIMVVILCETIGLWFLNSKLNIPDDRMEAATICFHVSIAVTALMVINTPFNADVIANEKMSFFAYVSIVEVVCKLLVAYIISWISYDKLITYSFLLLIVQFLINCCYYIYCKTMFCESQLRFVKDWALQKEMLSFSSWTLIGNLSNVLGNQGLNFLLNMFFGPVVNAARGIALQCQNAILRFGANFQVAIHPQITKAYAAQDLERSRSLFYKSINYTFYLLFFLSLPVLLEINFILSVWLKNVPENTSMILRFMLVASIIDCISSPTICIAEATGNIKKFQLIGYSVAISILPFAYVIFKNGGSLEIVFALTVLFSIVTFVVRFILIKGVINTSVSEFFKKVVFKFIVIIITSSFVPILIMYLTDMGWLSFLLVIVSGALTTIISYWTIGLSNNEKAFALNKLCNVLKNRKEKNRL